MAEPCQSLTAAAAVASSLAETAAGAVAAAAAAAAPCQPPQDAGDPSSEPASSDLAAHPLLALRRALGTCVLELSSWLLRRARFRVACFLL